MEELWVRPYRKLLHGYVNKTKNLEILANDLRRRWLSDFWEGSGQVWYFISTVRGHLRPPMSVLTVIPYRYAKKIQFSLRYRNVTKERMRIVQQGETGQVPAEGSERPKTTVQTAFPVAERQDSDGGPPWPNSG